MSGCAIDLDRLSSAYGTTRVCDEISLRIRRGAKVVLVGSNGAGKSSLLNILAGKRRPVGGSALVLGEDAFECTTLVQRIALVTSEWMECVPGTNLPVKTLVASSAVGVAPERVAELVEVLGAHLDGPVAGMYATVPLPTDTARRARDAALAAGFDVPLLDDYCRSTRRSSSRSICTHTLTPSHRSCSLPLGSPGRGVASPLLLKV